MNNTTTSMCILSCQQNNQHQHHSSSSNTLPESSFTTTNTKNTIIEPLLQSSVHMMNRHENIKCEEKNMKNIQSLSSTTTTANNDNKTTSSTTSRGGGSGKSGLIQLQNGFIPNSRTVICARGKRAFHHEGNVWFRGLVQKEIYNFSLATSKLEKSLLITSIMNTVNDNDPNGGFVKQGDNGNWFRISEATAREKVGQT